MSLRDKTNSVVASEWDRAIAALTPQPARRRSVHWLIVFAALTVLGCGVLALL